jgi:hypothetical protein
MLSSEPAGIRWNQQAVTWYVQLLNTDGSAATAVPGDQDLLLRYTPDSGAPVSIAPAAQTPAGAWTSGGWCAVDAVNCPGLFRLDLPDAVGLLRTPFVTLTVASTGLQLYAERIPLVPSAQLFGAAASGTLTQQQVSTSGLPTLGAGQLNRRQLQFLEGPAAGELVLVVGQTAGNLLSLAPPLTAAPVAGNRFVVR